MNKEMNEKIKEVLGFIVCTIILVAIGFYSGFFNKISFDKIALSFKQLPSDISGGKTILKSPDVSSSGSKRRIAKYNNYQPNEIPKAVIDGAYSSNTWTNIFNSDKKVIFYVYSNSGNDKFNSRIQHFIRTDKNWNYYNLLAYPQSAYNSIRANDWGTSKICNSIEECNQVRLKAANYTMLSEYINHCSRAMCIIHPKKRQYFILREKNPEKVITILNDLKLW